MYAIVDIETTGGHAGTGFITEVAIILHNGHEPEQRYQTLVNPGIPIPRYVQSLTGITDAMVADAPAFSEVAAEIHALLERKIFVAHNVNFDYSFLKHHLALEGYTWDAGKLCTIRMARKIFPGYSSYSLGNICRSLDIPMHGRHRAMGDAEATAKLFTRLVAADQHGHIQAMLRKGSKDGYLPVHLSVSDVEQLPHLPGVYYFHDEKQSIIYVGKARDLKKRVTSHFSNNSVSRRKQELIRNVHRITYSLTGSECAAIVMESLEIRKHWPRYNKSQKHVEFPYGIFSYEDIQGRIRLGIGRLKKYHRPHIRFGVLGDAHRELWRLVREYRLCPSLCFLQKQGKCEGVKDGYCDGVCEGREDVETYNQRVWHALSQLHGEQPSFAILEKGRQYGEMSCILMEDGRFYGFGFIPETQETPALHELKELITPYPENEFVRTYIKQYAERNPTVTRYWRSE